MQIELIKPSSRPSVREAAAPADAPRKKGKQRSTVLYELPQQFVYRRAFSECQLLESFSEPSFSFKPGYSYNFITGGDVDQLTYLKAILLQQPLHYLLASTWCMAAADILQFREWVEGGKIEHLDFYVGEIFGQSYAVELNMLQALYDDYPELGRIAIFRNHSKCFAGYGDKWPFVVQSSANINTNPRTEQACISLDQGLFEFYKEFYDGIRT